MAMLVYRSVVLFLLIVELVKVTFGPLPQHQKLRCKSWPRFHSGMFCSGVQPFSTKDFVQIWTDSKELSLAGE